jgi:SAM-dependent methyltransferase
MTKPANSPPGSFAPSALTADRLPPRQRWDHRYGTLSPEARVEPTPFVAACLPKLPAKGRALDVAAGAGRHTIALAQRGLQVDAVDISTQGLRLARARALAAGLTPGEQLRFIVADIERPWLPHRDYEVILVSFFLHRPLFQLIKERLGPGGWLVYETFTVEQKTIPSRRPKRYELLLKVNELKRAFSDFEVLFYDEGVHNKKVTAQLLARKPSKTAIGV